MYDSTGTKGEETDCPKRLKLPLTCKEDCSLFIFYELVHLNR
jgi:hypothetical protein